MYVGKKAAVKRQERGVKSGHEARVRASKSLFRSLSPIASTCRVTNAKKLQLMEEIERENRILFEKMMKIKQKTQRFGNSPSKLSLNGSARKLRMKEISRENLTMLNRIQRKESHYSLDRMNGERRETEKYLSIISEFPLMGRIKRQMSSTSNGLRKSRKSATGVTGAAGAAGGKDAGKLLIRQGKIWNGRSFLVEVHKNSDNFRVVAYDLGHPDRHMLHLLPCEVREVCGDEMDLKKLLVRIDLDDGVLAVGPLRPLTSLNFGEGLNGAGGGIGEGV